MHSSNSISKITLNHTIALLPLIFYGFYKNGILPFRHYEENIYILLKPLILPMLSFFIGYIFEKFYYKKDPQSSLTPVICTISAMIIPPTTNTIIYLTTLLISLLLAKFLKLNYALTTKLSIAIIMALLGSYTYANIHELNSNLHFTTFDLIFGRSRGGLCATNTILCLLSYSYLANTQVYKKQIPPLILTSYILTTLLFLPTSSFQELTNNFLKSTIIFSSIFLAPLPIYSPITKKEIIIYSILTGIISAIIINTLTTYEGAYIALLITPIMLFISNKLKSLTTSRRN